MTVKDLISMLYDMPQDADVVIPSQTGGESII